MKKCKKGLACGGSCISPTKKCKRNLSPTQAAYADAITQSDSTNTPAATTAPETSEPNVQVKDADLESNRSGLVNRFGEELINTVESNIQDIINSNDVMIRVPSERIDAILAEGGMLNSAQITERKYPNGLVDEDDFEAVDALDYQKTRNQFEELILGMPMDTPASNRPIYGYVGNSSDMYATHQRTTANFGDVAFKLKPEVKERASVGTGDSWSGHPASKAGEFNAGSFAPSETFKNASLAEYKVPRIAEALNGASKAKSIDDYVTKTGSGYLEYQIQGGVKTSDIAEMHYTNGQKPSANTMKWAKENGVKIYTYDRP